MRWFWYYLFLFFFFISACGPAIKTNVQAKGPNAQQVASYTGPKARIAISAFTCKAENCDKTLASAATDMVATSLFQTGRFILLERGIGLQAIQKEIDLNQTGYVNIKKSVKRGLLESADILILGTITALKPDESGIIIPVVIPWKHHGDQNLAGALLVEKKAYIVMEIRLVNVHTGRIIAAFSVEGQPEDWEVMITDAAQAIVQNMPEFYYRHGEAG
ncbi:MAG: hypothetical protein J7M03_03855 [Candidatus Desulfofervidaceae bacterium]|nr:hypothetical protein [Candidatus Desulfofervidaceae bacterium]